MKNLPIIFLAILLISCNKDEKEDATINYYLSTTSDTTYQRIFFQFDYISAHRQQNNEIRTVYLYPTQVDLDLNGPEEVFLGSSTIEPEKISGYEIGLGQFRVVKENDTLELIQPSRFNVYYSDFPLEPSEEEELNVTFILDVEASVVLDSAGQNWIKPQVKIEN